MSDAIEKAERATAPTERRRLHERVRQFIDRAARGDGLLEPFERLALDILRYQAAHVPAYARLCAAVNRHPGEVDDPRLLPAVPTDAFRLTRIAAHPALDDVAVFRTSGTTGTASGEHHLSTTDTYERAALAWGRWALFFDEPVDLAAIVLAPRFAPEKSSSLHFMLESFTRRWAKTAVFLQTTSATPIDSSALANACEEARRHHAPAILLGTSFAFVHALDALAGRPCPLPPGSRAMHTGGFKGRSREVAPQELRDSIARTFDLVDSAVVGEYGMTELSSQMYEGTLRSGSGMPVPFLGQRHGIFLAPPWLRAVATDPDTLLPLCDGETGILRFEDLANVDGALAIQTADRGRVVNGTVELFGRSRESPPRGCSLMLEELLGP